ncbi:hypothetical protein ITJ43_11810 [Microbacterium sp. VKM Ac-2870]|uniref:hypothetical protein n=1 Tax=Microbacterium sp. VKM Ac-2870 TaxID=2783825 RepID=UPI00188AB05D|nr:hypothetical protein [Microbacterium sp. VKM Ac-2870]MBF4562825.1 hypothetical protein [Microbacterium sp. VKM Ac-2870]
MLALHALAAVTAVASCCCLGLSPGKRDRRAWALSVLMVAAMAVGLTGGSIGLIVGVLALVAAAPIAVTGARGERSRGLHRALGALAMGALMIAGAGHGMMTAGHSHGYGAVVVAGVATMGALANLSVLVPTRKQAATLPIAGEALFMVAGVALMAAA